MWLSLHADAKLKKLEILSSYWRLNCKKNWGGLKNYLELEIIFSIHSVHLLSAKKCQEMKWNYFLKIFGSFLRQMMQFIFKILFQRSRRVDWSFDECSRKWQAASQFDLLPAKPPAQNFFNPRHKLEAQRWWLPTGDLVEQ